MDEGFGTKPSRTKSERERDNDKRIRLKKRKQTIKQTNDHYKNWMFWMPN